MKWFYRLEAKYGKYAFKGITYFLIMLLFANFVTGWLFADFYKQYLQLDIALILKGEIWRIIAFFITPDTSILYTIIEAYMVYWLGNSLENAWGTFKYNVYIISGMILHIVATFVVYFIWGYSFPFGFEYLLMTMFLAYTIIFSESIINLFFFLPIKAKWLGVIDGCVLAFIIGKGLIYAPIMLSDKSLSPMMRTYYEVTLISGLAALICTLNLLIFIVLFRRAFASSVVDFRRRRKFKNTVSKSMRNTQYIHKCAVCGRTEADGDLSFRYCSKCNGNYEYCNEHLYTHQHVE